MSTQNKPHDPEICGLDRESSCPACREAWEAIYRPALSYSTPRQLWARLAQLVGHLRRALCGVTDLPAMPERDHAHEAALLRAVCEPEVREALLTALAPGIRAIARDELHQAGGDAP